MFDDSLFMYSVTNKQDDRFLKHLFLETIGCYVNYTSKTNVLYCKNDSEFL